MGRHILRLILLTACTVMISSALAGAACAQEDSICDMDISDMKASEMLDEIPHVVENSQYEKIAADCLKAMEKYNGKDKLIEVGVYTLPSSEIQAVSDYLCYGGIIDPRMSMVARVSSKGQIKLEIFVEDDASRQAVKSLPLEYQLSMQKIQEVCKQAESYRDEEKVRYYHDWIKDQTSLGGTTDLQYTMYGVFYNKMASSRGYSIAMQMMCRYSGISSRIESFPEYNQYCNVITINNISSFVDVYSDDKTNSYMFYMVGRDTLTKLFAQYLK